MSKTLQRLAARNPDKVAGWYKDSDGYWIDLKRGWCRSEGDEVHTVSELTVKEALDHFKWVARCGCEECNR